jgi:hypothetical protein
MRLVLELSLFLYNLVLDSDLKIVFILARIIQQHLSECILDFVLLV